MDRFDYDDDGDKFLFPSSSGSIRFTASRRYFLAFLFLLPTRYSWKKETNLLSRQSDKVDKNFAPSAKFSSDLEVPTL